MKLAALALAASLLTACHDASHPLEPEPRPALDAGTAALLSVALHDALARLVPASEAGDGALRDALATLTSSLAEADAGALDRRMRDARLALAAHALEPADADAVRLALDAVGRATGRTE